jgi:pimeloyl-ACP methyl ester carboxylesterase
MLPTRHLRTSLLDIAYETAGPEHGHPVLLFHGWPDDVRTYDGIVPALHAAGFRTFVPWLRGFGPTRFLSEASPRSGQIAAMAQDALDFADGLGLDRFSIVGHDWGARIAYFLAAVVPSRVPRMVTLSLGWDPGPLNTPPFDQARRFWYQWFMATDRGAAAVKANPVAFARFQWDTWSPPGWFDDATFETTAASFANEDWPAITIHSYRVRWEAAEPDARYDDLERRQRAVHRISVPTLLVHGADDRCVAPEASENKEAHFTAAYERRLLPGVGHFPTREAPGRTAAWIADFLRADLP